MPKLQNVTLTPGNAGLCGGLPAVPLYSENSTLVRALPSCPSHGLDAAAIAGEVPVQRVWLLCVPSSASPSWVPSLRAHVAGIVVGAAVAALLAAGLIYWAARRRAYKQV